MESCLWIGTSGWVYPHWRVVFYPPKMPQSRWFAYYATHFPTVEINNTFYHLPPSSVFDRWRAQAPSEFRYAVKANRYLTHIRRLQDCREPLTRFLERARRLGPHLGPILYQLPPRWKPDVDRLAAFLSLLPSEFVHVVEFRDPRWFLPEVEALLSQYKVNFCIFDMPDLPCPHWVTGPVVYIRFHGSGTLYGGSYPASILTRWAQEIQAHRKAGRAVYVYFNNDAHGYAVLNAQALRALLEGKEQTFPGRSLS